MPFRLPPIDPFSFWLGIILSTIFWWIVAGLRPLFRSMGENIRAKRAAEAEKRIRLPSVIEAHYRQMVLSQAQGMHLAAPLFSLDEIIEPPLLLAPPPRIEPGMPIYLEDVVSLSVPYLPTWPELAAKFKAETLTLDDALSSNTDIVLTGHSGSGKTVALAALTSRLARQESVAGVPESTLPFLAHVADLDLPLKKIDEPLVPIINLVAEKIPVLDLPRTPDFIKQIFKSGRAMLLLDGTDELTPEGQQQVVEFIKAVKRLYPDTRMITTATPDCLDGLISLDFIPFVMAGWGSETRMKFLVRWADLWTRYVAVEAWAQSGPGPVDPILLNQWINADSTIITPLELTLKTWGVYAGDIRGPNPTDAIETHLIRMTPPNTPRQALKMLALQVCLAAEPIFDPRRAREWVKSFEPAETASPVETEETMKGKKAGKQPPPPSLGLLSKLAESGLLKAHLNNRMRFSHPVFGGYLSGYALVDYKTESILDQPTWIGKALALQYLAAFGDPAPLVAQLFSQTDRPLFRNILTAGRWLRDAPPEVRWRGVVMAKLAELLQQEGQPLGLRGQALSAFVLSGDPAAAALFRQLFGSQSSELLQLAILGSGAIQDTKSIPELVNLLNNPSPNVRRAACLALVTIGTTPALEAVASVLLHGDENMRRAAAEALANHPTEGLAMLKEGMAMKDDLMVRRAVVYGLGRIHEPWTEELLVRMSLEDDQWIVRNSAAEVMESRQQINPHVPRRLPPPSESPWLIAYAGKQGMGVTPDKPPTDLLLNALRSGTEDERLASLSYLRRMPSEGIFGVLYQTMYGGDLTLREAVFQAVFEMAAQGVELPDPQKFGVGV